MIKDDYATHSHIARKKMPDFTSGTEKVLKTVTLQ